MGSTVCMRGLRCGGSGIGPWKRTPSDSSQRKVSGMASQRMRLSASLSRGANSPANRAKSAQCSTGESWMPSRIWCGVALALMGFFQAIYLAMIQTILQMIVPNRLRGRVLSIWMLGWGLTPVGLLPMSAVAENLGTPVAMVISGVIGVAVAVAVMAFARQLWSLDPEAEMIELGEDAEEASDR